jgi:dienelactone hydrolase
MRSAGGSSLSRWTKILHRNLADKTDNEGDMDARLTARNVKFRKRGIAAFAIIAALAVPSRGAAPKNEKGAACPELAYSLTSYESAGKRIQVEQYRPKRKRKLPILILVHGAAGVLSRRDASGVPEGDNFGEKQFACNGFLVFLPHFLDSTNQASALNRDDMARNYEVWLRALGDAIGHAVKAPHAQTKRIFLFGESLGGYLSISLASQDRRIKAVSVFGAGMPPDITLSRMPPVLIQHGEVDTVVPVSEALILREALKKASRCVDWRIGSIRALGTPPTQRRSQKLQLRHPNFSASIKGLTRQSRVLPAGDEVAP